MGETLHFMTIPFHGGFPVGFDSQVYFQMSSDSSIHHIPRAMFCEFSRILSEVISSAQSQNIGAGASPGCPIILTNVSSEEFELLGSFIRGNEDIHAVEELTALFRVAYLFRVPDAIRMVISKLSDHPEFRDSERLHLSLSYGIASWFRPALRSIIMRPLGDLSSKDIGQIGAEMMSDVIRIKMELEGHRRSLIVQPPTNTTLCEEAECLSAWRTLWAEHATPVLLAKPLGAISRTELVDSLRARGSAGLEIRAECLEDHLALLTDAMLDEEDIIDHFVERLFDLGEYCRLGRILDQLHVW